MIIKPIEPFFYLVTLIFLSCNNETNHIAGEISKQTFIETKVDSLMQLMTIEEKIGQMNQYNGFWDITGPSPKSGDASKKYEHLKKGYVGSMLNVTGAEEVKTVQKIAVEETRLGIPLIIGFDVIHGYKTLSPIPLAEAASWDLKAIKKSAQVAAKEADILNDNWELTWIETGLYNLDDCKNVGNKTYFIVCYVKEFRDSREALSKQLLSSENSEGETRQEEIPLNIAFEKEREYNDSAWDKMMNGNYKEALDDINKSIKYFSDESNNDTAAMIYFHLKDYKNALKHANVSVKMNDSGIPSPEHLFTRAKILVKLGKTAKAIKDLEDALYWEDDWYDGYEDAKKLLKEIIKIKL